MKIIDMPFDAVDEIYHLADIHIRLFKRHEEYREVFSRLYKQFNESTSTNKIIVVAGDIVHAKTDMSPEMLELASEFLKSLADIAPTFIIAGNHDLNLSNKNRLDSLTPIVNSLNHKNLVYFKHSGVYQVADVDFAVFSILDEPSDWPTVSDTRVAAKKIALFHGPVHGAVTDTNYVITNRHVDISSFDGFDAVLLGDIHRYQVLQHKTKTTPTIVYASSLIQQSHGEAIAGHGWCKWNLEDFSHTFMPVQNTYGYYTLEITNNAISIPADMPKNVRIRLIAKGMDMVDVKKATAVLRAHRNVIELSLNKVTADLPAPADISADVLDMDVTNVNNQNKLIKDWIERRYVTVNDALLQKIIDLNTRINTTVPYDDNSRNIHWRPVRLTFSNMFSYGDKNEINFDTLAGIYGIFAPNAVGKSASIDALIFCLYDKTPRAFRGDHIMNNRCNTFECELKFEINQEIYYIRRTGTRKKTGDVKVDVSFWKEDIDGSSISLNGEDRRDTNATIRNYVGSYEDFILTSLSSQNASALFIDKSHSERKDLLIQFMGLNVFDKLFDAAHEESKELTGALKKFKKIDFSQMLTETQTKLETARQRHTMVEQAALKYKEEREMLDEKLRDWQGQRKPSPNITLDIDILRSNLEKINNLIVTCVDAKTNAENKLFKIHTIISERNRDIATANLSELRKSVEEYNQLSTTFNAGASALKLTTSKVIEKEKFKAKLESYKYNPNCNICVENNISVIRDMEHVTHELIDLYEAQSTQQDALERVKTQMESLVGATNLCEKYEQMQLEIQTYQKKASEIELEIQKLITEIEKGDRNREHAERDIELFQLNEENIKHNKQIDEHLNHVEHDITVNKKMIDKLEKELRELHGEIKVLETSKADIMRQIKEAEELEDTYEAYKYYMEAVGRDGVPYELMTRAIPEIELEINNILTQIVNFTISLEVDGKNILGRLIYDNDRMWPLENSSGMERFISSLAIRVALINASNLPKSNFLIIDEGLGALDVENLGGMSTMFGILKSQFDFMIVISHLDAVRDMVDKVLDIKREDGFSYINV
jgi:DNA repair exonuclease SbcCD ATPase subunit